MTPDHAIEIGTPNKGGKMVTAGGLVFIAAVNLPSGGKRRALEKDLLADYLKRVKAKGGDPPS